MKKRLSVLIILILSLSISACANKAGNKLEDRSEIDKKSEEVKSDEKVEGETYQEKNEAGVLEKALESKYDEKIDAIVNKQIEDKVIPGAVVLAVKDGKIIFEKAYGYAQLNEATDFTDIANPKVKELDKPRKMEVETLFDLASITKIATTTQAIMKLDYEGKLDTDDLVTKYLPDFGKNGKDHIRIKDLLTHSSGMPEWVPSFLLVNNDREKLLDFINDLKPEFPKGRYKYSDIGFMTLGYIVEKVSGARLEKYVEDNIYKPLGMKNTFFNPLDHGVKKEKIAATSMGNPYEYRMVDEAEYPDFGYDTSEYQEAFKDFKGWKKHTLIGETNDGNASMASCGVGGHAGLFSTVEDLAILSQTMLNGGQYKEVKLYDQKIIDKYTKNYLGRDKRGLGFDLNASYMGDSPKLSYGHNGFTGTHLMVNPDKKLSIIVLTNKQNLGLNEKGSYNRTFDFVNEISNIFLKD